MNKEQIDICKDIIKILNKASFNVTGPEMVDCSNKIRAFARLIIDMESKNKKDE